MSDKNEKLRSLPKVDKLLTHARFSGMNTGFLKLAIRDALAQVRSGVIESGADVPDEAAITEAVAHRYDCFVKGSLYKVVNATGVPIHTNLGRSPISKDILTEASELASGYSNLEYDVKKGKRGDRYHHAAEYLRILTGAEDAIVVNNNASAVFLVLNTFANRKEVVVSRGELVEIGGSFRVPDVMSRSGAKLVEVGTTNKTRISDYTEAVSAKTSMLMKVHKSNYEIVGFSEEATLDAIVQAARDEGVLSYYDAGSGLFSKVLPDSICADATIPEISAKGFDLISFSGDKMLGGCQAGIIVGRKELISKLKKNQLMRMLRVDKLTLAILQAVFRKYIEVSEGDIPVNRMLSEDLDSLKAKAEKLAGMLGDSDVIKISSTIGGGSCPLSELASYGIALNISKRPATVEKNLRKAEVPVVARIIDERVVLDVRTIDESEFEHILSAVEGAR